MKKYEFICEDCGNKFDKLSDTEEKSENIICISCKSKNIKRISSPQDNNENYARGCSACRSCFGF